MMMMSIDERPKLEARDFKLDCCESLVRRERGQMSGGRGKGKREERSFFLKGRRQRGDKQKEEEEEEEVKMKSLKRQKCANSELLTDEESKRMFAPLLPLKKHLHLPNNQHRQHQHQLVAHFTRPSVLFISLLILMVTFSRVSLVSSVAKGDNKRNFIVTLFENESVNKEGGSEQVAAKITRRTTLPLPLFTHSNNYNNNNNEHNELQAENPKSAPHQDSRTARNQNNAQANKRRSERSLPLASQPPPPEPQALILSSSIIASGSKNEPPSRPSVDWSKQRPYFGPDMQRNVSVELGKTAYLTCKVYELGDKTVSWLRPRENEILTAGRYTYIGDSRFASINDNGSHDWILEIKDVGLNDSTSYECQVSTDPKMSTIINLNVKAAKAKIKQGEQFYAPINSNIEFTCEIGQKSSSPANRILDHHSLTSSPPSSLNGGGGGGVQQTYWYFNGNLLNYARAQHGSLESKNFSIDWDPISQLSRFKLFNVQPSDAGNYTCKPTSSEPATIRLHVKRFNKSGANKDRTGHHNNGHQSTQSIKEAQRNRQLYGHDLSGIGIEMVESKASTSTSAPHLVLISIFVAIVTIAISCPTSDHLSLLKSHPHHRPQHLPCC